MSKNLFCYCLSAIAISCLLLVSCSTEDTEVPVYAPTISVSAATVTASVEGGSYSFTYTVSNAAEDGAVQVSAGASWINNVTDSGSTVSFTVSENTTGETRTGIVSLTYSSSYGSVSKTVTVAQNASALPVLTVQPTAVAAEIEGGTYSFTYSITNPASDGELVCTPEVDWISNVSVGTNSVSFTVDENEGTELREGVIAVAYVYGSGELDDSVTVVQDHQGGDSGNGGGGGGDVSDLIGTYSATGYAYYESGTASEQTWTLKIYASSVSGYDVFIDGLVPSYAGQYPGTEAYIAQAKYTDGKIVIPAQLTGYKLTSGYYLGWYPCSKFESGTGWYRSQDVTECTLTYSDGKWTSDYGVFLALFTTASASYSYFYGFGDVVNPEFVLTKTSSTTDVDSNDVAARPFNGDINIHTDNVICE